MESSESTRRKRRYRARKSIDRRMVIAAQHIRDGLSQADAIAIADIPKRTFHRRRSLALQLQTLGDY